MNKAPAFQFYADDFLAGTMDMTQAEVGAYIRLLSHQWSKGALPSDPEKLRRMAGGKVTETVLSKFVESGVGTICNPRLKLLQEEHLAYRKKKSDAANMRWIKERDHADALQVHMQTPCKQDALLTPYSISKESICADAPSKRFQKPTIQELETWFSDNGLPKAEGGRFFDYYESKGWVVGRAPMKSWKATCQNWKRNFEERHGKQPVKPTMTDAEILKNAIG